MIRKHVFILLLLICGLYQQAVAQQVQRHKIALFTPLYLDSAFDATGNFVPGRSFPRYITPGLDFYMGAQMALDSLQKKGAPLDVYVYDSRSKYRTIADQLRRPEMSNVEMIISPSNLQETKILAQAAQAKKIPFISATLPNDAGVTNNPYFVVLNSSLQSHIEGIYKLLVKNFVNDHIIVFRKAGAQEDMVKNFFVDATRSTPGMPAIINYVDVGNAFTVQSVLSHLDSTRRNICIAGSLDESFGMRLAQTLASATRNYPITLIGMPTWETMNFSKSLSNLDIIYSTPFYFNNASALQTRLTDEYYSAVNNRPGDMFYRGYETMLRFALLLLDTKKDVSSNLTRKGNYVFTLFDIQPVFKNKKTMQLDYFENKHLYFIKVNGSIRTVYSL
ncbi:MAG: ABC transporter substrate-binding protein [Candidatus Dadabacteria bacterium]